jgi:hypothetical protein
MQKKGRRRGAAAVPFSIQALNPLPLLHLFEKGLPTVFKVSFFAPSQNKQLQNKTFFWRQKWKKTTKNLTPKKETFNPPKEA